MPRRSSDNAEEQRKAEHQHTKRVHYLTVGTVRIILVFYICQTYPRATLTLYLFVNTMSEKNSSDNPQQRPRMPKKQNQKIQNPRTAMHWFPVGTHGGRLMGGGAPGKSKLEDFVKTQGRTPFF